MSEKERFHRWTLTEDDLTDLTPLKARDIIVKCFFEAQKETFARSKQDLGLKTTDEELLKTVSTSIRMVFKELGVDFEKPTAEGLMKVVETLARKASSWGTPKDIIDFHGAQVMKVLQLLR